MIGQIVPSCQDTLSQDGWTGAIYFRRMVTAPPHGKFNEALCARVKRLRELRVMTAEDMAKALDIPAERYRKYESRSPLPHYLIERFALIVGRDVEYVLTGNPARPRIGRPPPVEASKQDRRKTA